MHKTIYFLKRLGVLHNISISFQPYDERRSCNVVETEFLANYTVFVSLALILSVNGHSELYSSFTHTPRDVTVSLSGPHDSYLSHTSKLKLSRTTVRT